MLKTDRQHAVLGQQVAELDVARVLRIVGPGLASQFTTPIQVIEISIACPCKIRSAPDRSLHVEPPVVAQVRGTEFLDPFPAKKTAPQQVAV